MHKPLKFLYDLLLPISRIPGLGWMVRPLKLIIYTIEGLMAHGTMDMSAALTFYSLISIVPVLALVFAVVKGFGLAENLAQNLYGLLPQMPEVVDYMVSFANNTLARTNGGVVAAISIVTLFWAVIRMFESIEMNFNKIWEVKSTRNMVRKYSDYITVVIIAPLLWIIATSIGAYAKDLLGIDGAWWLKVLSKLISLVFVWAMFTFVYLVLPNTKVRLRSALLASVFAGTGFYLFQALFVFLMRWMTSYSAIYGSFAALPLFLLWMQNSWSILLLGCELSFALQNEKRYDEEREIPNVSHDYSQKLMVAIMYYVARAFMRGEGSVPMKDVRESLGISTRIANKLLAQLVVAGMLNEVKREEEDYDVAYAPARDIATLKVSDLLQAVDDYVEENENSEMLLQADVTKYAVAAVEQIKQTAWLSDKNILIKDIVKNE
ncbi:MAG: YihY family inner membrane protein [Alistipes sp.]|nr:YihY family inner membrane protein [Alistipes sp.]